MKKLIKTMLTLALAAYLPVAALAQVQQVQEQKNEDSQDTLEQFVVYTGKYNSIAGVKFYQFDFVERKYEDAIKFCESMGMRLMRSSEAYDLSLEVSPAGKEWLGRHFTITTWSSDELPEDRSTAWVFHKSFNHRISFYAQIKSIRLHVRCLKK